MVIKKYSQNKLLKKILVIGVAVGIVSMLARFGALLLGVSVIFSVVGGGLSEQSTNEFMAEMLIFIDIVAPYLMSLGVLSIFLYVLLFPDKESRLTLIFWGIIMFLYLLALIFYPAL